MHNLDTCTLQPICPAVWDSALTSIDVHPFSECHGPKEYIRSDPAELFNLFFTQDIISSIVLETNRYAAQCLQGTSSTWSTCEEEIRAYFGFYIFMGLVKMPEIRDYWSNDDTFHYTPIASKISRHRFEEISRYLHFVDKTKLPARGTPGHHRLQHVKPVLDALKERFSRVYQPGPNLSVDEAMVPLKGNCE